MGHVGTFVRFDRFVELALPEASSGSMKKSSLGPKDSGTAVCGFSAELQCAHLRAYCGILVLVFLFVRCLFSGS